MTQRLVADPTLTDPTPFLCRGNFYYVKSVISRAQESKKKDWYHGNGFRGSHPLRSPRTTISPCSCNLHRGPCCNRLLSHPQSRSSGPSEEHAVVTRARTGCAQDGQTPRTLRGPAATVLPRSEASVWRTQPRPHTPHTLTRMHLKRISTPALGRVHGVPVPRRLSLRS